MITQEIKKPDIKKENLVSNVSNDNSNNKNVSDKIDLSEIANKNRELKLSSNKVQVKYILKYFYFKWEVFLDARKIFFN